MSFITIADNFNIPDEIAEGSVFLLKVNPDNSFGVISFEINEVVTLRDQETVIKVASFDADCAHCIYFTPMYGVLKNARYLLAIGASLNFGFPDTKQSQSMLNEDQLLSEVNILAAQIAEKVKLLHGIGNHTNVSIGWSQPNHYSAIIKPEAPDLVIHVVSQKKVI